MSADRDETVFGIVRRGMGTVSGLWPYQGRVTWFIPLWWW